MVSVGELCGLLSEHTLIYMQTGDSCEWTTDSQRLILSSFDRIRDSPTDMYRYVLPFCPSSSWLHEWHTPESLLEVKVVRGHLGEWGMCTRVVSLHLHPVALACWKDIIAVGLMSGDIIILDAITGSSRSVFSGHLQRVRSLAFSLDGTLLVSGSEDGAIKLWDVQTGGVVKTFWGQADSVSISPDSTTIASGSRSGVCLWDVGTGKCQRHDIINTSPTPEKVTCLNFLSAIPGRLAYVSCGLVQQWDTNGSETGPTTSGRYIAFFSDGKRFVLCHEGHPTVRDTVSGAIIATLHRHGRYFSFSLCCFSPSDEFVAGVTHGDVVYVWNVADTPRIIETFLPAKSKILSLAYSSSLVSMHIDGTIRFLRIDSDSPDSTARVEKPAWMPQAKITYTTLQGEEGIAISADAGGTIERWDLSTGLREILLQTTEIQDVGGARLVNDILTVVHRRGYYSSGWDVSTWDIKAGERLQRIPLSDDLHILYPTPERDLGISKDGTTFFVVDPKEIRTWYISTGGNMGSLILSDYTCVSIPLAVSLDGPTICFRSSGGSSAWGWDLRDLKSSPLNSSNLPTRLHLAYLQAGEHRTDHSKIVDSTSQIEVFRLPEKYTKQCGTVDT